MEIQQTAEELKRGSEIVNKAPIRKKEKKTSERLNTFFAHISCCLALILITLLIFDAVNKSMGFLDNNIAKGIIGVLAFLSVIQAVFVYEKKKD